MLADEPVLESHWRKFCGGCTNHDMADDDDDDNTDDVDHDFEDEREEGRDESDGDTLLTMVTLVRPSH